MEKYYRVKKDNFMWKEGAIISDGGKGTYTAVQEIWNNVKSSGNADYFERVYPDTVSGKLFRTKDQMIEMYKTAFNK
jgi:hypothetical protein